MTNTALWLRHEDHPTEQRAVIAPTDARVLVDGGIRLTVEDSPQRIFPTTDYAAAGCHIVEAGRWPQAPDETVVIGVKEPASAPFALRHRHIFFGHAYQGQHGARHLIKRFADGGGQLLDLEYLTDGAGRRVAAFGYWAGYLGAALAVLHHRESLVTPLRSRSRADLDEALRRADPGTTRALVIGALGRSGRGARDALAVAGIATTGWDLEETRNLDRQELLRHDLLVNTVFTDRPCPPFLAPAHLVRPGRRLRLVADVTCDFTSDRNLLPIYDRPTNWQQPVRRLLDGPPVLDLIAIDNLPSLLPREASLAFSTELRPHLSSLPGWTPVWQRTLDRFHHALTHEIVTMEDSDA